MLEDVCCLDRPFNAFAFLLCAYRLQCVDLVDERAAQPAQVLASVVWRLCHILLPLFLAAFFDSPSILLENELGVHNRDICKAQPCPKRSVRVWRRRAASTHAHSFSGNITLKLVAGVVALPLSGDVDGKS